MSRAGWESYPIDLEPLAPETGPFAQRPFLETVWRHRDDARSELLIELIPRGAVALALSNGHIEFAGQENLTDYHSPLGSAGVAAVVNAIVRLSGHSFSLDSLPHTVALSIATGLEESGVSARIDRHETVSILSLPESYDEWLTSIGKKERHEVRRKRRRFEAEFGKIAVVRQGIEALDGFCRMHRSSRGDKAAFMTGDMQDYFGDLMRHANASIHTLVCDSVPRASAFGFETEPGFYYYNSAYDPDAALSSPGIVLLAALIEDQIERGAATFDFLKGGERYKIKHGAEPRPLFTIDGVVP
ncbi:MAG: GNAT family N-acetyltransferase [Acidimicrobiia bacterium]